MKKHGRKRRVLRIRLIFWSVILIAVILYLAGVLFFRNRFYSRQSILGVELTGQKAETVETRIKEKIADYQLDITTRDGVEKITADDLGLAFDDKGDVEEMLEEQNPFLWFLSFTTPKDDIRLDIVLDEQKLTDTIDSLDCFHKENIKSPTDACLKFENGSFEIVPETEGNEPDRDRTVEALRAAVYEGEETVSLDKQSCYVAPKIYRDNADLIREQTELNRLLDVQITYDFGDRSEVVDAEEIADWIVFGEDFSYDLDEDKVWDYVHGLGLKYDTFGLSREFKTHSGQKIKLRGGDYGWCINKDKTTESLMELIQKGKSTTTEPVYLYKGVCRDTNDIGSTYIEVSIASQTLWFYKDGKCVVSTPVVTGNVSRGTGTPSGGVWAIDAKLSPYTLRGEDYESDVTYWLPFNGNVGIHDADWRNGKFGGSIYKTNGSHGCVNTPYSAVKKIYENVKIGYPVVVY